MSIKRKLIVIMLLTSVIPLVLLSAISIRYLNKSLEEETIKQCQQLTSQVEFQVNGYIDKLFTTIKTIASNPNVRGFDLAQTKTFLNQTQRAYPEFSFALVDGKGNQVVRGDDFVLVNVGDRPYVQTALKGADETISDVVFSRNGNRFVFSIGTPVRNTEIGAPIGVMQGSIILTQISSFVTKLSTDGTVAYIIDSSGKILAHPDEKLVNERTDMSEVSFVGTALAEKKSGFSIIDNKGTEKKLATYTYDMKTGWLVCLEVPYSLITAKTYSLSLILGSVTVVI